MKYKALLFASLVYGSTGPAHSGAFDGTSIQLGIGGSNVSSNVSGTAITDGNGTTLTSLDGTHSEGSFNGITSIGFSKSLGDDGFNLAANLFYLIGNQNAGNITSTYRSSAGQLTESGTVKLQNTWGIAVEPGWNFTTSTLGYAKLAWVNSTYKGNLSADVSNFSDPTRNASSAVYGSKNLNGFGYGLGIKQMLSTNVFAGIDVMGVSYQSYTNYNVSAKPTEWMGFASIGYKF